MARISDSRLELQSGQLILNFPRKWSGAKWEEYAALRVRRFARVASVWVAAQPFALGVGLTIVGCFQMKMPA